MNGFLYKWFQSYPKKLKLIEGFYFKGVKEWKKRISVLDFDIFLSINSTMNQVFVGAEQEY